MEKSSGISKTRQLILLGIVPAILIVCAVIASLVYYREVSYSTLQYRHSTAAIQFPKDNELIPGDTVHGEFIAQENNLGALGIKITTFNRINSTAIAFRLREKGQKEWYCYNTYFTDRFPNEELYPFGFPVIKDSAGKTYEFEILAGNGEPGNSIGVLRNTRFFVSRYTFDKHEILSNKSTLFEFLRKKVVNLLTDANYLVYLSIFFIPLVVYVFTVRNWQRKRKIETGLFSSYVFIIYISVVYIISPVLMKSDVVLFVSFIILVTSYLSRISYQRLFTIAAVLILICPVWFFTHQEEMANRSALLVFFFILSGLLLISKELLIDKQNRI